MSPARIQEKIDKLVERRRRAWAAGAPTFEMNQKLGDLYSELRLARARGQHGPPGEIIKRARVDRELEKLMG